MTDEQWSVFLLDLVKRIREELPANAKRFALVVVQDDGTTRFSTNSKPTAEVAFGVIVEDLRKERISNIERN